MILWLSKILLPFVISYVIAFGLISHRPIFDDFLDGVKSGMKNRGRHFADPDRPDHGGRVVRASGLSGCGDQCLRRGSRAFCIFRGNWYPLPWCVWFLTQRPPDFYWIYSGSTGRTAALAWRHQF